MDPLDQFNRHCSHYFEMVPSSNVYCRSCGIYVHMDNDNFQGAEFHNLYSGAPEFNPGDKVFIRNKDKFGIVRDIWGYVRANLMDINGNGFPNWNYYVDIKEGFEMPPRSSLDRNIIVNFITMRFYGFQLAPYEDSPFIAPPILDEVLHHLSPMKIDDGEISL